MFYKKYIVPALRSINRNKATAALNLTSLVVGLTSMIFIAFWIKHELSYDNFHPNADRTYRIVYNGVLHGSVIKDCTTGRCFYDALKNDFPEIEYATTVFNFDEAQLAKENGESYLIKLSAVCPDFFDVFGAHIIKGNAKDLEKPNIAFLTPETARKFFGDEDPIGKIISTGMSGENKHFTVAGLVSPMPENSHFEYDMLYSNTSMGMFNQPSNDWLDAKYHNYFVLKPGVNYKAFEAKFNQYAMAKIAPLIRSWRNLSINEWESGGNHVKFELQPIERIHLIPGYSSEFKTNGNILYIYIFMAVGILILIISIINFSNLSIVKSLNRAKEIGIKKVSGSDRKMLAIQFLTESSLLSLIATFISILIVVIAAPFFMKFTGVNLFTSGNFKIQILAALLGLALFTGFLSGLYPALYLSKLSPVKVLNSSRAKFKGVFFKDFLIVSQFVICIVVFIGAFIVNRQLNFLQNENLGFKKDNILVLKGTDNLSWEKNLLLNNELQKITGVINSTSSQNIPAERCSFYQAAYNAPSGLKSSILDFLPCDYRYKDVYQLNLLEGDFFTNDFTPKARKIVLNQTAVKALGIENWEGKFVRRGNTDYQIVGVVEDFHYSSKQAAIPPLGLVEIPDTYQFWSPVYCSVLMQGNNIQSTVKQIKKVWNDIAPGIEFRYTFFDQDYDHLYYQETQTKKVFIVFALIAISLSCFGLFGFVKYLVQNRTKEIGIRKVNGARTESIFVLLSKHFTSPVIIAMTCSFPLAYIMMRKWLESFAYRVQINYVYFLWAGLLTLGIVFLTVGWLGWRAARKNPVEALRYE